MKRKSETSLRFRGYFSPFYNIPVGVFLSSVGLYGIYLKGFGLEIALITLGGLCLIMFGIYGAFHYDDNVDDNYNSQYTGD
jgi:hypothetical protein